jgi:predicted kinase/aminoglycoside phosphotransferase family enzyme
MTRIPVIPSARIDDMSQTTGNPSPPNQASLELDALVDQLVAYHGEEVSPASPADAGVRAVRRLAEAKMDAIRHRLEGDEDLQRLAHLGRWLEQDIERISPVFEARHARLVPSWALDHPNSRLHHQGRLLLSNAIGRDLEAPHVDDPLDPACDLASLLVGLESRHEEGLAHQVLDRYLSLSGDYEITRLLSLFRVCHALSGARRSLERRSLAGKDLEHPALLAEIMAECRRFLALAEVHADFRFPPLVISVGVSGSGKSRFTRGLVEGLGAVRLCSDVERRRLVDTDADGRADLFYDEATHHTYQRLASLAGILLDAGLVACVDGTFLRRWQRDLLRQQAEARGLPCLLVSFEADHATLKGRIETLAGLIRDHVGV